MFSCSFVDKKQRDEQNPISQCAIDLDTLNKFIVRLRGLAQGNSPPEKEGWLQEKISTILEIIGHEIQSVKDTAAREFYQTAIRCFVMLLQLREMEDYNFHSTFERIVELFGVSNDYLRKEEITVGKQKENICHLMVKYIVSKEMMISTIQKFQSYICIVIMEKIFDQKMM